MNAARRVLIIDSDLKSCKAIKYTVTEYGIGAYYTLSVIDGIERRARIYEMGDDFVGGETNAIPISVSRLRQKLDGGKRIENVRGVGYRFIDPKRKKE